LKKVDYYYDKISKIRKEISKVIIGQDNIITCLIRAIISNGHVLLEGVPGLAKTILIKTLAEITSCKFSRIQFTPDLLPSDIIGVTAYEPKKGFYTIKGPIFSNFVLGDEINRAPPKVQSALLEAMQEKQVTIGNTTFKLQSPFFVLATQNPIESAGTYPLPEAQVDRFLFKLFIDYPLPDEEEKILERNVTLKDFKLYNLKKLINEKEIIELQKHVKNIYLDDKIRKYIVRITEATRRPKEYNIKLGEYIAFGASPRASIGLFIASKADAFLNKKTFVTPYNIKNIAHDVLRHRIILNYEGQTEAITTDDIIKEILSKVSIP
jgi:MoxR-like ATPase